MSWSEELSFSKKLAAPARTASIRNSSSSLTVRMMIEMEGCFCLSMVRCGVFVLLVLLLFFNVHFKSRGDLGYPRVCVNMARPLVHPP